MNRREEAVAELERAIGYRFGDRDLLERALTHASVGEGAVKVRHYERLEFLGDRVLNLMAAERLMEANPEAREGELSRLMARTVNYHACAAVAREAGLGPALRLSASATKIGARESATVLGDACEALIGAIYVDGGMAAAKAFFDRFWTAQLDALVDAPGGDPKSRLQEWSQGRGMPLPTYAVTSRTGPDHAPDFTVQVAIAGLEPASAQGRSKQEAEKAAAALMLARHAATPDAQGSPS